MEGRFPDVYAGKVRPAWPPGMQTGPDGPRPLARERPATPVTPAPGRLVVTGCARMWDNLRLTENPDNRRLLLNCVGAVIADEDLLAVRAKEPRSRRFDEPSDATARAWSLAALVLVPLGILGLGAVLGFRRLGSRERWNREHGR